MRAPDGHRSLLRLLEDPLRETILEAAGSISCHLVGGTIRDHVALGVSSDDWDLVVGEDGETVASRLAAALGGRLVRLGGERFAAHRIVVTDTTGGQRTIDLWDRQGLSLDDELRRRDLTVNSIAIDLARGTVVDPLEGWDDLAAGRLRANAPERFVEDPLRSLRLLRFTQHLPGFVIEPDTVRAARLGAARLQAIAGERVRQELERILGTMVREEVAERLVDLDLFPRLWAPELTGTGPARPPLILVGAGDTLARLAGTDRGTASAAALVAVHHALLILASESAFEALRDGEPSASQRASEVRSRRLAGLVERRWVGRATAVRVERLLQPTPLPSTDQMRRLYLHHHGQEWTLTAAVALQSASQAATPPDIDRAAAAERALTALADREGPTLFQPPVLLDGHDLERDFGIEPGPRMGSLLRRLGEAQAVGTVRTPAQARRWMEDRLRESLDEGAT